jgi:DNA-directed RNA polymerase specialized sigma24 family protein
MSCHNPADSDLPDFWRRFYALLQSHGRDHLIDIPPDIYEYVKADLIRSLRGQFPLTIDVASEIAHDCITKIMEKAPGVGPAAIRNFMLQTARNEYKTRYRTNSRQEKHYNDYRERRNDYTEETSYDDAGEYLRTDKELISGLNGVRKLLLQLEAILLMGAQR